MRHTDRDFLRLLAGTSDTAMSAELSTASRSGSSLFRIVAIVGLVAMLLSPPVSAAKLRTHTTKGQVDREVRYEFVEDDDATADAEPASLDVTLESLRLLNGDPEPNAPQELIEAQLVEPAIIDPGYVEDVVPLGQPTWRGIWTDFDALVWWRTRRRFPVIVATGPIPGAAALFGGDDYGGAGEVGGRLKFGYWLDVDEVLGIGGNFNVIGTDEVRFSANRTQFPTLALPFFDIMNPGGGPAVLGINDVNLTSESNVLSGDLHLRCNLYRNAYAAVDFLTGYQFARIDEDLTMIFTPNAVGATPVTDVISAKNEFHAAFIGLQAERAVGTNWRLESLFKIAVGSMTNEVSVAGNRATDATSGFLAQDPQNVGLFSRNELALMEELGVNLVWRVTSHLDVRIGYSFLYWNDVVAQPGEQIDTLADTPVLDSRSLLPGGLAGATRPDPPGVPQLRDSDFILHGLNLGAELRF